MSLDEISVLFIYQLYAGFKPPFVIVDDKKTLLPLHTIVSLLAIDIVGDTMLSTLVLIILLELLSTLRQLALLISVAFTESLLLGI